MTERKLSPRERRIIALLDKAWTLSIAPSKIFKCGYDEHALRRIIAERKRRMATFKPRHPRRWWEGLSDLERAQHAVKCERGVYESFRRRIERNPAYREEFHERAERWRQRLEAAEIRVGLRPDSKTAKLQ